MAERVSIPGSLAVLLVGTACSWLGGTVVSLYGKSGAIDQHQADLRDIKAMRDRELDSIDRRLTALEARNCKP